jgi:hypothetical protein
MKPQIATSSFGGPGIAGPYGVKRLIAGFSSRFVHGMQLVLKRKPALPEHAAAVWCFPDGFAVTSGNHATLPTDRASLDGSGLQSALKTAVPRGRRVMLFIHEALVLTETIRAPLMPKADLEALGAHHARYQSPFPADETAFFEQTSITGSDAVELAIAMFSRECLDPALIALADAGLVPVGIATFGGSGLRVGSAPDWLVGRPTGLVQRWQQLAPVSRSWLLAAALVLLAYFGVLHLKHLQLDSLQSEAGAASEALVNATRVAEQRGVLAGLRQNSTILINTLETLSADLPDTAFVEALRLENGKVTLTAYAPAANDVLSLVSKLEGVQDSAIDGAITRDSEAKIERFALTARIGTPIAGEAP